MTFILLHYSASENPIIFNIEKIVAFGDRLNVVAGTKETEIYVDGSEEADCFLIKENASLIKRRLAKEGVKFI